MPETSTRVPVGNARIAAQCAGVGRPVVFVHANVADRRMWRHQFDTVATTHRAIALDRRGFGETALIDERWSPVDDVLAVLDQLAGNAPPAVLVASSSGGSLAIDVALAAPTRIAALVLAAPGISGAPAATPAPEVQALQDAIAAAREAGDIALANRWRAALWLDGPLVAEGRVTGPARDLFRDMNAIALATPSVGTMVDAPPAWGRLQQLELPVRILCGDLDLPHIQTRCAMLAKTVPDGKLDMMVGTAHLPSLEQPERFTARLQTLLAELS